MATILSRQIETPTGIKRIRLGSAKEKEYLGKGYSPLTIGPTSPLNREINPVYGRKAMKQLVEENGQSIYSFGDDTYDISGKRLGVNADPGFMQSENVTPTVVSSTSITDKKIPELKSKIKTLPGAGGATQIANPNQDPSNGEGETDFGEYSILGESSNTTSTDPLLDAQFKFLDDQTKYLDANAQQDIERVKSSIQGLMTEQRVINEAANRGTKGAILSAGGSPGGGFRYAPYGSYQAVANEATAGVRALSDLVTKENDLIAGIRSDQADNNFRAMGKKFELLETVRKERAATAAAIQKSIIEGKQKRQEEIDKLVIDAAKNGAPISVREAMTNAPDINTAIQSAGEWLQTGSGIVGEYLFYKRQAEAAGQMPVDFDTYQDRDANRKRSVVNINTGSGSYSPAQEKVITRVDTSVSNNATYKKAVSVNTSIDVINSALNQKNGLGDIAAINQFQKVIDEGAVTRDQDVKLIQGAQGLADSLALMKARINSGQQLSDKQREQMKKLITDIQSTQKTAIDNDAFLKSKKKELERNNIDLGDTIFGSLEEGNTVGNELIQTETNAKTRLNEVLDTRPDLADDIVMLTEQGLSNNEIIEYLGL